MKKIKREIRMVGKLSSVHPKMFSVEIISRKSLKKEVLDTALLLIGQLEKLNKWNLPKK